MLVNFGNQNCHEWLKFLFTCANYGINLITTQNNYRGLNVPIQTLFSYVESTEAPINENTCQYFQNEALDIGRIDQSSLLLARIGYCKNLTKLQLYFYKSPTTKEISFVPKLQKLQDLQLKGNSRENAIIPLYLFDCKFPSLTKLEIIGDLFGSEPKILFSNVAIWFPNLSVIILKYIEIVPENIFVNLSKLLVLVEIKFQLIKLTDQMFTQHCESQQQSENKLVPAITTFKKLQRLTMFNCSLLTDNCILQGVLLNTTLLEISLTNAQFTDAIITALTNCNYKSDRGFSITTFKRNNLHI